MVPMGQGFFVRVIKADPNEDQFFEIPVSARTHNTHTVYKKSSDDLKEGNSDRGFLALNANSSNGSDRIGIAIPIIEIGEDNRLESISKLLLGFNQLSVQFIKG